MQVEISIVSFIIAIFYCSIKSSSLPFSARLSPDAIRVPDSVFSLSFLLTFLAGIYFVTLTQEKSCILKDQDAAFSFYSLLALQADNRFATVIQAEPGCKFPTALLFLCELRFLFIFIRKEIEVDANSSRKTPSCGRVHMLQIAYIEYLWYNILN